MKIPAFFKRFADFFPKNADNESMNIWKKFAFIFICSFSILQTVTAKTLSADLVLNTQDAFAPDGDGIYDELVITLLYKGGSTWVTSWKLVIIDQRGFIIKTFSGKNQRLPKKIIWKGSTDTGSEIYSLNDYAMILKITPYSKDEKKSGQKQVSASANFTSGILLETVEKGKKWKFAVNSLQFASGRPELKTGTEDQILFNNYILEMIAAKLKEMPDTAVTITAFENNLENTTKSNIDTTLPHTQARAETILEVLVRKGISRSRLNAVGRGGANELSSPTDEDNSWKNSRIEFDIEKQNFK